MNVVSKVKVTFLAFEPLTEIYDLLNDGDMTAWHLNTMYYPQVSVKPENEIEIQESELDDYIDKREKINSRSKEQAKLIFNQHQKNAADQRVKK